MYKLIIANVTAATANIPYNTRSGRPTRIALYSDKLLVTQKKACLCLLISLLISQVDTRQLVLWGSMCPTWWDADRRIDNIKEEQFE
jgi:hypothetical protein